MVFQCRTPQCRRRSVTVLGCISVEGPRFIRKIDGHQLDVRGYIAHLAELSMGLVAWEPANEKDFDGWKFVHPNKPVPSAGAVKYWFESQSKIRCIPWPQGAEHLLPMQNVWRDLVYELNKLINSDISIDCLWSSINEVWPKVANNISVSNAIFSIPFHCSEIVKEGSIIDDNV